MRTNTPVVTILKDAIKARGSLYRVAKDMGVAYSTAHKWKTGKSDPQARHLLKLIELAGKKVAGVAAFAVALALSGHGINTAYAHNDNGLLRHNSVSNIHYAQYKEMAQGATTQP